jgi:hypothetical protein
MPKQNTVVCGKCGTSNSFDEKKCTECGEYLHQFKNESSKPENKKKKGFLSGCLTVFVGLFFLGVIISIANPSGRNSSTTNTEKNSTNSETSPKETPVMNVSIEKILKDYENNKLQAEQKYDNKRIKISGIVTAIGSDIVSQPYVTIGTGAQFEVTQIQCMFEKDQVNLLAKLNKGQPLSLAHH